MINNIREITRKDGKKYTIRQSRDRVFLPSEWLKFFDKLGSKRDKLLFEFLINTGARINEVRNIKVRDIDFKEKTIWLKVVKRRNDFSTGKIRKIPISSKFCKRLKNQIKDNKLSPEDTFNLLSTPAGNTAMKKALNKSGIEDWKMFSCHNVRKTLETWLMAINVNEIKLLPHFGHNKATAVTHYLSTDIFNAQEKSIIKRIVGNLYHCDGQIDFLYDKINQLENLITKKFNEERLQSKQGGKE